MKVNQIFVQELGKNISITSGQILSRVKVEEPTDIKCEEYGTIVAKTVGKGFIDDNEIRINKYSGTINENKFTKEGDIVIKNSFPCYAVLIDKKHEGLLVSSFCSIIRGVERIRKDYLVVFFNSNKFQNDIVENITRSTMSVLSNSKILECQVPLFDEDKQIRIINQFNKIKKEEELFKQIIKLENDKINLLLEGE